MAILPWRAAFGASNRATSSSRGARAATARARSRGLPSRRITRWARSGSASISRDARSSGWLAFSGRSMNSRRSRKARSRDSGRLVSANSIRKGSIRPRLTGWNTWDQVPRSSGFSVTSFRARGPASASRAASEGSRPASTPAARSWTSSSSPGSAARALRNGSAEPGAEFGQGLADHQDLGGTGLGTQEEPGEEIRLGRVLDQQGERRRQPTPAVPVRAVPGRHPFQAIADQSDVRAELADDHGQGQGLGGLQRLDPGQGPGQPPALAEPLLIAEIAQDGQDQDRRDGRGGHQRLPLPRPATQALDLGSFHAETGSSAIHFLMSSARARGDP